MTANEFEMLDENGKNIVLFEANKIAEKIEDDYKTELFQVDEFFIESKITLDSTSKRVLTTLKTKIGRAHV